MADFIQTFRRLHPHDRQHVLALLPAELTPYEWRALHAATSTRSFRLDIIGRLPLELVAQVFSYLDPAAPYRWQTVSRRWHHVLRSQHVPKASLGAWYQGTLSLQDADYASCEQTALRIHRFRTGRPASVYKMALDSDMAAPTLLGDHLVWLPRFKRAASTRFACVLNLHTWQLRHFAGEAREQIFSAVASDQIVMLSTTTNTCYVYDLHRAQQPKKFTLPARMFLKYVACHGRIIACIAPYETHTSVFIWNYDTQRGTSFDISHSCDSLFAGHSPGEMLHVVPLINPENETITLLLIADVSAEDAQEEHPDQTLIVLATYTFRGEYIASFRPSLPYMDELSFRPGVSSFVPADDSNTLFTVRLNVMVTHPKPTFTETSTLQLQFNAKTCDLSICEGSAIRGHDSLSWWKDTCYGFKPDTAATMGDMITYMGTHDTEACVPIVSEPKRGDVANHGFYQEPLLINEKYVIRTAPGTVYLACFHENSNRPNTDDSFFDMGRLHVMGGSVF